MDSSPVRLRSRISSGPLAKVLGSVAEGDFEGGGILGAELDEPMHRRPDIAQRWARVLRLAVKQICIFQANSEYMNVWA